MLIHATCIKNLFCLVPSYYMVGRAEWSHDCIVQSHTCSTLYKSHVDENLHPTGTYLARAYIHFHRAFAVGSRVHV